MAINDPMGVWSTLSAAPGPDRGDGPFGCKSVYEFGHHETVTTLASHASPRHQKVRAFVYPTGQEVGWQIGNMPTAKPSHRHRHSRICASSMPHGPAARSGQQCSVFTQDELAETTIGRETHDMSERSWSTQLHGLRTCATMPVRVVHRVLSMICLMYTFTVCSAMLSSEAISLFVHPFAKFWTTISSRSVNPKRSFKDSAVFSSRPMASSRIKTLDRELPPAPGNNKPRTRMGRGVASAILLTSTGAKSFA